MSKTYYNHAFTIAFEVISEKEYNCRADAMLEALKRRVREMEEDLARPEVDPGYDPYILGGPDLPKKKRRALIHEAAGPSYDSHEMDEEDVVEYHKARNMPLGRHT